MSWLSKGLSKVGNIPGNIIPHVGQAEKRANMYAAREQMQYYQSAKDELHKQSEDLAKQKEVERSKLHEKQIRALRGSYRKSRPGFMQSEAGNTVNDTLG